MYCGQSNCVVPGRQRLAVGRPARYHTPDLMKLYVVLYHSKFPGHGFPVLSSCVAGLGGSGEALSTVIIREACH